MVSLEMYKIYFIVAITILLLVLLGLVTRGYTGLTGLIGITGTDGFANMGTPAGTFTLYYADWCPHCKTVKPEFEAFAGSGYMTVNGKNIAVKLIEESNKAAMAGKEIKGFPTILYETAAGETVEYSGPRNKDGWMSFLKKTV